MAVQFFLCQKIKIRRNFFQRSADIHEGIFRILRDEIESIDFLQRASDNLRSKEDSNEELIELLLPSLLLLHMEMSSYLREEAEWSQLLNNKTALYVTGRTCDHGEYSVLYAILSTYYEMVLKNHIVFITEGNIK